MKQGPAAEVAAGFFVPMEKQKKGKNRLTIQANCYIIAKLSERYGRKLNMLL